jgi:hypothetical protein
MVLQVKKGTLRSGRASWQSAKSWSSNADNTNHPKRKSAPQASSNCESSIARRLALSAARFSFEGTSDGC